MQTGSCDSQGSSCPHPEIALQPLVALLQPLQQLAALKAVIVGDAGLIQHARYLAHLRVCAGVQ